MKSNLVDGFALPFAVALIAIFTIIFGSILTTTNFYNQQKLNEAVSGLHFVQDNQSHSIRAGTVRGMHFQMYKEKGRYSVR